MDPHHCTRNSVQSLLTFFPKIIAQWLFPCQCATWTDRPSEDLRMGERLTHCQEELPELDGPQALCQATANKLTDDALLDIFDFYLYDNKDPYKIEILDEWHTLVHVCRRKATPVREMLDIWPALPLVINDDWTRTWDMDNIIAALGHADRVHFIKLINVPISAGETLAAMQVPFPELKYLWLWSFDRPLLPDLFLGGSAPRLHGLWLMCISFPALRNLLLSANDLVILILQHVPHSGYVSPEAMVACLSSLHRLETLLLGFESPQSRPDQPSPPPQTRIVLPALTYLTFEGMTDYSEDFLARIDTPVLNKLSMRFFLDLVFDIPHLKQFIGRAKRLKLPKSASVLLGSRSIQLDLEQQRGPLEVLEIKSHRIDWQVDSMALVCGQLSPFFSLIEQLHFTAKHTPSELSGEDDIESIQFLELFRPFTAIRSLHVSRSLVPLIATALQVLIGPRATEVLPNLCDMFLGGSAMPGTVPEAMQPFVIARRLSGQPVDVHHWEGAEADW